MCNKRSAPPNDIDVVIFDPSALLKFPIEEIDGEIPPVEGDRETGRIPPPFPPPGLTTGLTITVFLAIAFFDTSVLIQF
jgi:hypothetical protein